MEQTDTPLDIATLAASPLNRCFACGPGNPHGLHLHFEHEGGVVRASFVPGGLHQGWQGVVHGGILATLLDEAMAYTLFYAGVRAVTARMEVRYRAAAHAGEELTVEARITSENRKIADVEARILRGQQVMAEAAGRFMKLGPIDPALIIGESAVD